MSPSDSISQEERNRHIFFLTSITPPGTPLFPEALSALNSLSFNVRCANEWCDRQADNMARSKLDGGELPKTVLDAANYKAQRLAEIFPTLPWTQGPNGGTLINYNDFIVDHNVNANLVSTFTKGLDLPDTVKTKLDEIFTKVHDAKILATEVGKGLQYFICLETCWVTDPTLPSASWHSRFRTMYINANRKGGNHNAGDEIDCLCKQQDLGFDNDAYSRQSRLLEQNISYDGLISQAVRGLLDAAIDVSV